MKNLDLREQLLVSGGHSCKEALELNETDWDFDLEPSVYCTKAQFTTYAMGAVDVLYTPGFFTASEQEQDDMMLGMIRGLNI
tara:strand:- start:9357 stop:9602 length:246 start_codon:yes stop_codon:yes gene_type:complete